MTYPLYLSGSRSLRNQVQSISKPWLDDTFKYFRMAVRNTEKKGEKAQALEVPGTYEIRPEVNLGSPIGPLAEIRRQAVMDATASHTLVSANALPGQILARIMSALRGCLLNLGTLTVVQNQRPSALDQAACHR